MKNLNIYYEAGKADEYFGCVYYFLELERPIYYSLFEWQKNECNNREEGNLIESKFDTLDKKIVYIKGIFDDYSGHGLKYNPPTLNFANSGEKVERCKKWIGDIFYQKQLGLKNDNKWLSSLNGILSHNITYNTIPICHTVILDKVLVDFIKNYNLDF